jgi:hypothetical protein
MLRRVDGAGFCRRHQSIDAKEGNMSNTAKNEEIVKKFLGSKVFDFAAFGKFVAENGESLASASDGEFGFVIGTRFLRYCIPPAVLNSVEGIDPAVARAEVTGR